MTHDWRNISASSSRTHSDFTYSDRAPHTACAVASRRSGQPVQFQRQLVHSKGYTSSRCGRHEWTRHDLVTPSRAKTHSHAAWLQRVARPNQSQNGSDSTFATLAKLNGRFPDRNCSTSVNLCCPWSFHTYSSPSACSLNRAIPISISLL